MTRLLTILAVLFPALAWGQGAIVQSGLVVPKNFACFLQNDVVYDCGLSSLTPGPLPVIAKAHVLGNETSGAAQAHDVSLTALIDSMCSTTGVAGMVLVRDNSVWDCLPVGTNGQFLETQGDGSPPQWATALGTLYTAGEGLTLTGTVFSLTAPVSVADGGTGLTAGTSGGILGYTATGTLASSPLLTQRAVMLGGGAGATPYALSSLGTSGQVLTSNGASADPSWGAAGGSGTVSSIVFGNGLSGGTVTTTGTVGCVDAASTVKGCPTPDGTSTHFANGAGGWTVPAGLAPVPLRGVTSAIGGGSLAAGACTSGTAGVTGATTAMVATASPVSQPLPDASHGLAIWAFVSGSNLVTVEVCAIVAATTPAAVAYQVVVNQ